jgi:hypothetical protein
MSGTSTAKAIDEQYLDAFKEFRRLAGAGVRIRDVAAWIDKNEKVPKPKINTIEIHARKLKQAIRKKRIRDLCGRQIQPVVAIKIEKLTAGGQKIFDVVYDYLHEMSLDHALCHFGQKEDNIAKQRRASTRNLQSCLDFNPNVKGHEDKFRFLFILDDSGPAVEESIEESPAQSAAVDVIDASTLPGDIADVAKTRRARDQRQPR